MRARRYAHGSLLLSSGADPISMVWYVFASLLLHVAVFAIMFLLPALTPRKQFTPSVIMVNMVSLSSTGTAGKPGPPGPNMSEIKSEKPGAPAGPKTNEAEVHEAKPAKASPSEPKAEIPKPKPEPPVKHEAPAPPKPAPPKPVPPEPKPAPPKPEEKVAPVKPEPKAVVEKPTDAVSLSNEKAKPKASLKKETYKSTQAIKNALERIEKKVDAESKSEPSSGSDSLASALNRLKSKVEKESSRGGGVSGGGSTAAAQKASGGGGNGGGGAGGEGGTGGTGASGIQPIDFYRSLIPSHIDHNWAFNQDLANGRTDLVAVIVVKIMPNGDITDIWFEKKSGNSYFDDSVFRAVKKSSPLPPLPREYTKPYYQLGLIFTPKGLKRG